MTDPGATDWDFAKCETGHVPRLGFSNALYRLFLPWTICDNILTLGSLLRPHAEAQIDEEVERRVQDGEEMVDAHQENGPLEQQKISPRGKIKIKSWGLVQNMSYFTV